MPSSPMVVNARISKDHGDKSQTKIYEIEQESRRQSSPVINSFETER